MLHAYSSPFNLKDQILSCWQLILRTAVWGRAHTIHGKQHSSPAASGSQLAAHPGTPPSAPPFPTERKLGHGTNLPRRARGISSGKWLAGYSDLFSLGLVWPSVIFRCQAGGCWMLPQDSPFPHFVWVLFWLTLWQWSVNYKGWVLQSLVFCIGMYVRETWVLRRYKSYPINEEAFYITVQRCKWSARQPGIRLQ